MKYIILFLLTAFFIKSSAQEIGVAYNSLFTGKGFVIRKGKSKPIHANQAYIKGDIIKLTQPSLELYIPNKGYIKIEKPVTLLIDTFIHSAQIKKISIFADYIGEVYHHTIQPNHKTTFQKTSVGSVRAAGKKGLCNIQITPYSNFHTDSNFVVFRWKKLINNITYELQIFNQLSNNEKIQLYSAKTQDTFFVLNIKDLDWAGDKCYTWSISPYDEKNEECETSFSSFCLLTKESKNNKIEEIKSSIKNEGSLVNKLILIDRLADEGFYNEADKCLYELEFVY